MKSIIFAFLFMTLTGCATQKMSPVLISGKTVLVQGAISSSTADEFLRAIESHDVNRVLIASSGGHVEAAIRMAMAIHKRGMDVEVFGHCFSSCANYIFPAGRNKSITGLGIVGWHGNMQHLLHLHRTGERPISGDWFNEVTKLAALEEEFFKTIGVDSFVCWFGKLPPYKVFNTYFLSADDMAKFGIKNVAVRDDYALSELLTRNAQGVENVRFIKVDWESLRRPSQASP